MNLENFDALQKRFEFVCENYHQLCRFCLDTNNLLTIFYQSDEPSTKGGTVSDWVYNDERNIGSLLQKQYVEFEPEREYGLPNNICDRCVDNLVRWHRFQETFASTTKLLLKVRDQFGCKDDPSETTSDQEDVDDGADDIQDDALSEDNEIYEIEYVQNLPDDATVENVTIIETIDEVEEDSEDEEELKCIATEDAEEECKQQLIDLKVDFKVESLASVVGEQSMKGKKRKCNEASESEESSPKRSSKQQCKICGMVVKAKMKHHLMRHSDPSGQPFKCSECGKSYSFKRSLADHIRQIHQNVRYSCDLCSKEFVSRDVLRIHKKLHTNEEHRCAVCDQVFQQRMYLKKHMAVHDMKKFTCDEDDCGKSFRFKEQLKQHRRVHTGEKPFGCDVCPKSFRTSSHLKQHMRTHTQEKVYKCKQCPTEYANKKSLERHISGAHQAEATGKR